jgi:hypothetical protein
MKPLALFLLLGSLLGCTGTQAPKAVETAQQPAEDHRFVIHGSPEKVALLLDSQTGKVWKYDGDQLALVPYKETASLQEPSRPANVPPDYLFEVNGPKGKGWYRPGTEKQ